MIDAITVCSSRHLILLWLLDLILFVRMALGLKWGGLGVLCAELLVVILKFGHCATHLSVVYLLFLHYLNR
jgi:hypothetical protein